MARHKPLADEVKAASNFVGIVNVLRSKDIGQQAFTIGKNVEITNTKKVTRRNGFALASAGAFSAVYGNLAQDKKYAVKGTTLIDIDRAGVETVIQTGLVDGVYCWAEDPNGNIYYTSTNGSNGIITQGGVWKPLFLPVPTFQSAGVVDPGTWEYHPFALGKKYNANTMQLMATYTMADGRETAPSETISLDVAPEVRMIRVVVPTGGVQTNIYATAPGGSTYFLAAVTTLPTITVLVKNMNLTATGSEYPYTSSVDSFPADGYLLCFYRGLLYVAVYDPDAGIGTVYCSLPLQYHLFDKAKDFLGVSATPFLLLAHAEGVIIGTSDVVYNWAPSHRKESGYEVGDLMTELTDYGVVPGSCGDVHQGKAYFWTVRGVAEAMPYKLLTEKAFSGDPGVVNYAHLFHERGYCKLVASTVSGNPSFNQWQERS